MAFILPFIWPKNRHRLQLPYHKSYCFGLATLVFLTTGFLLMKCFHGSSMFAYTTWKDVSLLNLLEMHLAARPTHVNFLVACKNKSLPGISREDIQLNKKIQHYETTKEKWNQTVEREEWQTVFFPALDKDEKVSLLYTYVVFKHSLDSANISHVLVHGSALGALRHHGLIPWDDDLDIGVSVDHWLEVKMALSCIQGFTLDTSSNTKWSFYSSSGRVIPNDKNKLWPFLDIFLYATDDMYVWSLHYVHMRSFLYYKSDMFPTQLVPFESFMAPVPGRLREILTHEFINISVCISHYMNHKLGGRRQTVQVPCSSLSNLYHMSL